MPLCSFLKHDANIRLIFKLQNILGKNIHIRYYFFPIGIYTPYIYNFWCVKRTNKDKSGSRSAIADGYTALTQSK